MPRPASADHIALPDSETHPHVCGSCSSRFVQPVEWQRAGSAHWRIELHCPECDWGGTGVFDDEAVSRFDEELERGTEGLLADLSAIGAANMQDEVERFVAALHAGHIVPEDF